MGSARWNDSAQSGSAFGAFAVPVGGVVLTRRRLALVIGELLRSSEPADLPDVSLEGVASGPQPPSVAAIIPTRCSTQPGPVREKELGEPRTASTHACLA